MLVMAKNSLDYHSNNMEINDNDTAVGKKTAVNGITDLGARKVSPENLTKPSSEPESSVQTMHIRSYKEDAAVCKELNDKLIRMVEENSSNSLKRTMLLFHVLNWIRMEKKRKSPRRVVTFNRSRGQLKKVWGSRGLPVNEKRLQSAASEDVFDMSSLNESLPSKPDNSDTRRTKAEKLAKEYLSFLEQKKRSYRKSEILRILASNAPTPNNNSPSSSSKHQSNSPSEHHQSRSLTRMVKKVYGDVKNVRIFSFRPLIRKDSNSSVDSKRVSCPELLTRTIRELQVRQIDKRNEKAQDLNGESRLQNGPLRGGEVTYKFGQERIVLMKYADTNKGKTRSDTQKDDSSTANILQNPERLLFNRNQCGNERNRKPSLLTQQLHDSISLTRQLSRLKIANSRRGDLSEGMDGSEIKEGPADQNKDEQQKVKIANRRRIVVETLRERYRKYQQLETEAVKKN